jgi:tetratricopeptide (TPR) repeat protein
MMGGRGEISPPCRFSFMHIRLIVTLLFLAGLPAFAQRPTREEEQRQRQALDHYKKGQDAMASERLEQAVQEFKATIQLDPLMTLAYYRLGQAHMALRDYPQAERDFVACREAYEKLGGLELTNREEVERRRDQEIDQLTNYLSLIQSGQIKNSNPSVPIQIQQHIDELQRNRRKGGSEAPSVPAEVYVGLGSAFFRQGKLAEAEKEWKTAASNNPRLGEAHNNLAVLYFMGNQLEDAEKELKLAEKAGYPVNPRLKDDIKKARKAADPK